MSKSSAENLPNDDYVCVFATFLVETMDCVLEDLHSVAAEIYKSTSK